MRDDAHKSAPVSRAWRAAMKCAGREGIGREEGRRTADQAVRSEVAQISPDFRPALERFLAAPGLPLNGWTPPFDLGRPLSPIEQRFVEHAEASDGPDRMERAFRAALTERGDANQHNIAAHGAKVDPRGVSPRSRTLREDVAAAIERVVRGAPPLEKVKVDMDGLDLSGGRK